MNFQFFLNSILLGIGLAMDAFSVSLANGFKENKMPITKHVGMSTLFALFQGLMPIIGWICVHTIVEKFKIFEYFIPWIALILLAFIGGKMIYEFFKPADEESEHKTGIIALIVQAIATSIDALSVGFTIGEYDFSLALICVAIIALVTFVICFIGVFIGKKFGTKFASKAELIGGIILVAIGIEIFVTKMIELYA